MCHYAPMRSLLFALFLALLPLTSAFAFMDAVFGTDQRVPMNSHDYPFSAIVKIEHSEGGHCTGSLVARDVVLTNAHCLIKENGHRFTGIKVLVHGLNGFSPSYSIAAYELGTNDYSKEPQNDWALIRINRPVGDVVGSFFVAATPKIGEVHNLAGYSGDFMNGDTAGVHFNCKILGTTGAQALLNHDCDMTKGSSGSPIWFMEDNKANISALNSAQMGERDQHDSWSKKTTNLAVSVENFAEKIKEFAQKSPKHVTGLVVCNEKDKKLKLAFGFWSEQTNRSKGWVTIKAKSCKEVKLPGEVLWSTIPVKLYMHTKNKEDFEATYFRDFCVGGFFGFNEETVRCDKMKIFGLVGELHSNKFNRISIK